MRPGGLILVGAVAVSSEPSSAQFRDPLKVQEGRELKLKLRGSKPYYSERWNLDDLPAYTAKQKVSGVIRQWGSNYFADSSLGQRWEEGFKKYHSGISFQDELKTALAGIPALTFGMADGAALRHTPSDERLLS